MVDRKGKYEMLKDIYSSVGSLDTVNISKITITDEWSPLEVEDDSRFKLRNASTVDVLVRTDTESGDDFWTVEPGELFPPGGFGFGLNYQVRVVSGSALAELISGK